ncbi:hypothetical protein ACM66B_005055 [Microbotryomycetes sp. NB124-2]
MPRPQVTTLSDKGRSHNGSAKPSLADHKKQSRLSDPFPKQLKRIPKVSSRTSLPMLGSSTTFKTQGRSSVLANDSSSDEEQAQGSSGDSVSEDWTDDEDQDDLSAAMSDFHNPDDDQTAIKPDVAKEAIENLKHSFVSSDSQCDGTKASFEQVNQACKTLFVDALGHGLAEETMKCVVAIENRTQDTVDRLLQNRDDLVNGLVADNQDFRKLGTRIETLQAELTASRAATAKEINAVRERTVHELDRLHFDFEKTAASVRKGLPADKKR